MSTGLVPEDFPVGSVIKSTWGWRKKIVIGHSEVGLFLREPHAKLGSPYDYLDLRDPRHKVVLVEYFG